MTTSKPKRITTQDGRLVGILKGNILFKRCEGSKHLFRKLGDHGSWGIDYDVLFKQLPERGAVHIHDTEKNILYMVPYGKWREMGQVLHFKEGTTDHYVQVFLPIEYFSRVLGYYP